MQRVLLSTERADLQACSKCPGLYSRPPATVIIHFAVPARLSVDARSQGLCYKGSGPGWLLTILYEAS